MSFLNHWWRLQGQESLTYSQIRKLSLCCGIFIFLMSDPDTLTLRLTSSSQLVRLLCLPCNTALIYSLSVTSATTTSFLSLWLALEQNCGASPRPSPAPACPRPMTSWCCILDTACLTSASMFHVWPEGILGLTFFTNWLVHITQKPDLLLYIAGDFYCTAFF